MSWVKVFKVEDLPEGKRKVVDVGGRKVLVVNFKGEFLAVDNACPHLRFPLDAGRITDDCGIICAFHHSAFDLRTGDVKEWSPWPPGIGAIAGALVRKKALTTFATKIEEGAVWILNRTGAAPRSESSSGPML